MAIVDIVLLIILIASAGIGYIRGLVSEVMRIFVWVGSVGGSYYVYMYHSDLLPSMSPLLIIILLFICFLIVLKLIQTFLDTYLKKTFVNFINQPLGLVYGLIRGLIVVLSIGHAMEQIKMESEMIKTIYEKSNPYIDLKQQEQEIIDQTKKMIEKFEKEFLKK